MKSMLLAAFALISGASFAAEARCPLAPSCEVQQAQLIRFGKQMMPHLPVADVRCASLGEEARLLECGFDAVRARLKSSPTCDSDLDSLTCKESNWRNLGLEDRAKRVMDLARKYGTRFQIQPAMVLCITEIETTFLEPMTLSMATCTSSADDEGIGQVTYPTLESIVKESGFKSRISPYNRAPYVGDPKKLFSALALDTRLQIEVIAAILRDKFDDNDDDIQNSFAAYNDGPDKVNYGSKVKSCYDCMVARQKSGSGQPMTNCLAKVYPNAQSRFDAMISACQASGH